MQKWEHKKFDGSSIIGDEQEFLEERGLLGWELVSVVWRMNLSSEKQYYFKRPLPPETTATKIFNEALNEVEGGHMEVKTTS
jgi:hypothetical protein